MFDQFFLLQLTPKQFEFFIIFSFLIILLICYSGILIRNLE